MSAQTIAALAGLQGGLEAWAWGAFLVLLRVGGAVALLPAFGEQSVPARVRLALALAFGAVVLPAVGPSLPPFPGVARAVPALLGEAGVGLLLGLGLRLFVLALQMAGSIAAQATSLSQLFGAGPGGEPSPAMAHLLVLGGLALAGLLGLHVQVAAYLIGSYALLPAGAGLDPGLALDATLGEVGRATGLAFSLAAPFVAASLLYNVTLGVINRAMPQLMVTFIGAPALTAGGLLLLLVAAPVLLQLWSGELGVFLRRPFEP
mgnify:CR=1 FL=1